MFKVDSNKVIRMTRGDYVEFPLFINRGTLEEPFRYIFKPESFTINSELLISLDSDIFKEKVQISDTYKFEYIDSIWTLNSIDVDLTDYGITILSEEIPENSIIEIIYSLPDNNKIYFYIYHINSNNDPVLYKEIKTDGTTFTRRHIIENNKLVVQEETITNEENVNSYGDIVIRLYNEDTKYIPEGEYRYQISGDLVSTSSIQIIKNDDEVEHRVIHNTLTNKLPIFILDDDVDRIWSN